MSSPQQREAAYISRLQEVCGFGGRVDYVAAVVKGAFHHPLSAKYLRNTPDKRINRRPKSILPSSTIMPNPKQRPSLYRARSWLLLPILCSVNLRYGDSVSVIRLLRSDFDRCMYIPRQQSIIGTSHQADRQSSPKTPPIRILLSPLPAARSRTRSKDGEFGYTPTYPPTHHSNQTTTILK